jgi:hypothetical protein
MPPGSGSLTMGLDALLLRDRTGHLLGTVDYHQHMRELGGVDLGIFAQGAGGARNLGDGLGWRPELRLTAGLGGRW